MSDAPETSKSQIIQLFPDSCDIESFTASDEILIENRDEMLEMLNGLIGRVEAFDIRALAVAGLTKNVSDDFIYFSRECVQAKSRAVGTVEILKTHIINDQGYEWDEA